MTIRDIKIRPALVIFALAVGAFAIGTTEFATMTLLPMFAPDLGIDAPTAGHVISAYALGVVIGAPVIAAATARMSKRRLLVILMVVLPDMDGRPWAGSGALSHWAAWFSGPYRSHWTPPSPMRHRRKNAPEIADGIPPRFELILSCQRPCRPCLLSAIR